MSRVKQASKRKRVTKAVPVLGAAGSGFLTSGRCICGGRADNGHAADAEHCTGSRIQS